MDALPSPVRRVIEAWTIEFERRDAMDRLAAALADETLVAVLRHLRDDIRMNPPTYVLDILTQRRAHIHMPITLPDCDPHRIQTGMRLPESHILTWRRRAVATWIGFPLTQ
jgi:hypothetical protein